MNPSILNEILVAEETFYQAVIAAQEKRHTALRQCLDLLMRPSVCAPSAADPSNPVG